MAIRAQVNGIARIIKIVCLKGDNAASGIMLGPQVRLVIKARLWIGLLPTVSSKLSLHRCLIKLQEISTRVDLEFLINKHLFKKKKKQLIGTC